MIATRNGLVKKSRLEDYDSPRSGGLIAVNLRDGDELVGAALGGPEDDMLLVSAQGQSIRFHADDDTLRPMGRATSGVMGMRFNEGDHLLSMQVVHSDIDEDSLFLLVATERGYSKRTSLSEYSAQGRGGKGVLTLMFDPKRGKLVGAIIVGLDDELYAITSGGGVIRTGAKQVRKAGRQTKGVRLMNLAADDSLLAIARNADEPDDEDPAVAGSGKE